MNRTRAADNVAVRPAPTGATHAPGYYAPGTTVLHEDMNMMLDGFCIPLEDGGVVLDTDNYEQFATLLGGVHAIASNIRSDLETTGVTTVATQGAVACANTICSGARSFAGGGKNNVNSQAYAASLGGLDNTNSSGASASLGGEANTNSKLYSASVGGNVNTNDGQSSASLGGTHNFTTGDRSASIGGYTSYNSGDRAVNCASQYAENIDDNCAFGGYGASAPANHGDGLTNKNIKWKLHNDTGNAEFSGEVTATGGLSTVTPSKFVAAYDLTDMRWEVTIDAIGGIIEIPFDSSFPLDGAILKMTNSKFGSGSRMYCQPVAPPTLTQTHGFVVNVNTDGEMYFHDVAAAIEETVQVWFDIINPI